MGCRSGLDCPADGSDSRLRIPLGYSLPVSVSAVLICLPQSLPCLRLRLVFLVPSPSLLMVPTSAPPSLHGRPSAGAPVSVSLDHDAASSWAAHALGHDGGPREWWPYPEASCSWGMPHSLPKHVEPQNLISQVVLTLSLAENRPRSLLKCRSSVRCAQRLWVCASGEGPGICILKTNPERRRGRVFQARAGHVNDGLQSPPLPCPSHLRVRLPVPCPLSPRSRFGHSPSLLGLFPP